MSSLKLAAHYFDGRSSRRHAATLQAGSDGLCLSGDWGERRFLLSEVEISEPMGKSPRSLRFADGARCEIPDATSFATLLESLGHRDGLAVRLQKRWSWALISLAGVCVALVATYVWVLPWGAEKLAPRIPQQIVNQLSESAMKSLDGAVLEPSKLSPERQRVLQEKMAAFAIQGGLPAYRLHFRHAKKKMPPNAFALPNGDIVIFDSLLASMSDDEALAVFAHELGHVKYMHGLRMLIQGSVVSTIVGLYLGDMSTIVAFTATLMLEANYSQEFESQADVFAARALKHAGKSPILLASALQALEMAFCKFMNANKRKGKQEERCEDAPPAGAEEESFFERWFSSHPSVQRRAEALKKM